MKELSVKGAQSSSKLLIGESLSNLPKYLSASKLVVITDSKVRNLYKDNFPSAPVIEIGQGEKSKTLATVEKVVAELLELGVDRSWFIVAIGGGIVCDVAGFIASIYMRGLKFGFVSTTLLAQVDASVGGKNGVNSEGYKNMLGVFNQPEFVICDTSLLKTLDKQNILCGIAEIIKHALIADKEKFLILADNSEAVLALDEDLINDLVFRSVSIKAEVVNEDEREQGRRRVLNLGHTIGHAIEKIQGISHGMAVAAGLRYSVNLSVLKGMLSKTVAEQINDMLDKYGFEQVSITKDELVSAVFKDKKRDGDSIYFIYLEDIGSPVIKKVKMDEFEEDINELFKHSS